jgi:hypothetical protein
MMSASECRAEALEAVQRSAAVAKPLMAERWQNIAREWTALASILDGAESLMQSLIDRSPE